MPQVNVGDIQMYYEIHGAGRQTLTMIRGLGSSLAAWYPQLPEFSKNFQTVVFDNRGSGRTDKPDAPYSIQQMAADVNGLLEVLNIGRTALLGVSMGGMIAQDFAINYSEKLTCLILGCTSFGGRESVALPEESLRAILAGPAADGDTSMLQERAMYCDETIAAKRDVIAAFNAARSMFPTPPFAVVRQADALLNHDASRRLRQIRVPTLVVTGKDDRLIPCENSRLIVARIDGAILRELPGGHLFAAEYPELFNDEVIRFVKLHG